jgi:hypothetical protein
MHLIKRKVRAGCKQVLYFSQILDTVSEPQYDPVYGIPLTPMSIVVAYNFCRRIFKFLGYFSYFEKIDVGLGDHVALCVCVCASPLSLLGNGSVKDPLSLLGNGSVKISLSLLGNGSVETLPR